jgi:hypothetical protein
MRPVTPRFVLAVGVALLTAACTDHSPIAPPPLEPLIIDSRNSDQQGFYFLFPIRRLSEEAQVPDVGFNAGLAPTIRFWDCGPATVGATACTLPEASWIPVGTPLTKTSGTQLLNRVHVLPQFQEYIALWNTKPLDLRPDRIYRLQVLVGGQILGFADVDVVRRFRELTQVDRDEYVALLEDFVLPIRFWMGENVLCPPGTGACASETVELGGDAPATTIELRTEDEVIRLDFAAATTVTVGDGSEINEVTVSVEACDGIDVDLPVFGECVRVTTFYDGPDGELVLSNPALVSLCVLEPGFENHEQENLVTLHQQDGTLVRALPHAAPNCEGLATRSARPLGLAARGWRWMRNVAAKVVVPTPLYARSRVAVFDVGGGGQTDRFGASCDGGAAAPKAEGPLPQMVSCPAASAPLLASTAVLRAPRTISDFQFALPAMMDYLNSDDASRTAAPGDVLPTGVKVTDWHGDAVQGATVTFTAPAIEGPGTVVGTAVSNSDGIAQIDWTIALGSNAVVASGRGIAAQNNYPEATVRPFMPDIEVPTAEQEPVVLRTGFVTFAATGGQGVWTPTGALPAGRRDHTATLLPDGDVLIVGGTAPGAFLYNPDAGSFIATQGAPLFNHGQFATATLLLDGRVLVVGGFGTPHRAELYDPSTRSFTATAGGETEGATNAARIVHSATLLPDGRVLLAGGQSPGSPPVPLADAEIYDPATDAFTPIVGLTATRSGHGAARLADGSVLIAGGRSAGGACLTTAEVFDPESGIFTLTGAMNIGRCGLQWNNLTVLQDGRAFVVVDNTNAELYNPATGTFSMAGAPSVVHSAGSVTLLADGRVLVAGGSTGGGPITTAETEIFNPATGTFSLAAPMTTVRQQHSATRLADGRVLIVGGFSLGADVGTAELLSVGGAPIP